MSGCFIRTFLFPHNYYVFHLRFIYSHKSDRIYIGQTNNISLRLAEHNQGKSKSTKHYRPWIVIYKEEFNSRSDAMKREKELKSHQGREFIRKEIIPKYLNR
ncbi:MAG: GIY-YIG nuclease family protein [Chlorobi bacterium]|nr:GIY-YIG nuclease family protein [Chlorobiota bacterium]